MMKLTLLNRWKTFKSKLKSQKPGLYYLVDIIETFGTALGLALLIKTFIFQPSIVPTRSMVPTLNVGDRLIVNKFIYRFQSPKRGDIIVFTSPRPKEGKDYVKRLIALPGERVEVIRGTVFIDGKQLVIPGVFIDKDDSYFGPFMVPDNSYFVMGDNRDESFDSRFWAADYEIRRSTVPLSDVKGRALFTFWPISHIGVLK